MTHEITYDPVYPLNHSSVAMAIPPLDLPLSILTGGQLLTDAASRPTRSDPRRWISLHYALAPPTVGLVSLVREVPRSIQQFR